MSSPFPENRPQVLSLLAEIKDNPDDDAPRLILADWLRDHDDPRGDFLAVQCRLASLPEEDPQRPALARQERRLLKRHRADWLGTLAAPGRHWEFRRGLAWWISPLEALGEALQQGLPGAEGWAWVEGLRVEGGGWRGVEVPERLAQTAFLPCLGALEFKDTWVVVDTVDRLADAGLLASLYRLRFEGSALVIPEIGSSYSLGRQLRHLEVTHGWLGNELIEELAETMGLEGLTKLNLTDNHIGQRGIEALTSWRSLIGLTHLELGSNRCDDQGASFLAACPYLARLTYLGLRDTSLGIAAAQALASSPHLGRLTSLDLSDNDIGIDGLLALSRSHRLANLKWLNIAGNPTSSELHAELRKRFGPGLRV
jgi:uncharacterized protein (TIGR02996 family)